MMFPKIVSAGFLILVLVFGSPSRAEIIRVHVEGTVTQNITEEPKWAPLLDDPVGAPVVASFEIDTDDFPDTEFPLVTLPATLQGLVFNSRVTIKGTEFSEKFVTSEPLLPPGAASVLRIGAYSLGIEDAFGTAPVLSETRRWESLRFDFGFGFSRAAEGTDLRNFEMSSEDSLFGNSRVSYTAGLVVDGTRQTDTWQSIIFVAHRMYSEPVE